MEGFNVRSAGTEESARIKVNAKLLDWADLIFVMEKHHRQRLNQKYSPIIASKQTTNSSGYSNNGVTTIAIAPGGIQIPLVADAFNHESNPHDKKS